MNNHTYIVQHGLTEDLKTILRDDYTIDYLDIEDVFTNTQLSKIEQRPEYLYVALEFPEYDKTKRQFLRKEVHTFVSQNYVFFVDKNEYKHFLQFNNLKEALTETEYSNVTVFYEMLDFVITKIFRVLGKFRAEISDIENRVFDDLEDDLLKEILIVRRNITNFLSIIYPLEQVIIDLQTKYTKFIDSKGQEKLDDSLDKIKKMINILTNYKEQIVLLTETNESQIARSTNQTIKTLTVFNIIIFVPSLITGFFGMNVWFGNIGSSENWYALLFVLVIMIVSTIATFIVFKVKDLI
jgi:magnesium transporter